MLIFINAPKTFVTKRYEFQSLSAFRKETIYSFTKAINLKMKKNIRAYFFSLIYILIGANEASQEQIVWKQFFLLSSVTLNLRERGRVGRINGAKGRRTCGKRERDRYMKKKV